VTRVAWIPAFLFVIAVPMFLVTASVTWAFNNPGVYQRGFEKYGVSRITGITDADLVQVGADLRRYFNSPSAPLVARAGVYGEERDIFNQREVSHLRDVKRLVWGGYLIGAVSGVYLLIAAGVGAVLHRRKSVEALARRLLWGGGLTLGLILAVGLFAAVGFDTLFLKFHQLVFANDFWQLDPRTDFLVMLFPQDFWFDSTIWVAIRAVIGASAVTLLSSGYLAYHRWISHRKGRQHLDNLEEASQV
jgi:integral membrane protein (TIGR01906 family)